MNANQQTVYGIESLIYLLMGQTPVIEEYTTINERVDVLPDARPSPGEKFDFGILILGNKGHGSRPGVDGIALPTVNDHLATDACLYGLLPLATRPLDDDLSEAERSRYCLRKVEPNDQGINVINYYGFRIPMDNRTLTVNKTLIERDDSGNVTETPFVPSNDNLFPEIPDLPPGEAIVASRTSVRVNAIVDVTLSEEVITEFVEAVKLKYDGVENYAIASEFGLCLGTDRMVEVESSTGTINFNESIGTQAYAYTMEHKALFYNRQKLEISFDIGNLIPLLSKESIPTLETLP